MNEPAIIRRASTGDAVALDWLFRTYGGHAYRIAARVSGSRADADDIVQDLFLGLPRALQHYTDQQRFPHWLSRVALRVTLTHLRTRGRRREVAVEALASLPDPTAERATRHQDLLEAIAALPTECREPFVLHALEGYSHKEIADIYQITVGASTMRVHRAWKLLRRGLTTATKGATR